MPASFFMVRSAIDARKSTPVYPIPASPAGRERQANSDERHKDAKRSVQTKILRLEGVVSHTLSGVGGPQSFIFLVFQPPFSRSL
jgi:hypothetical protein